MSEFAHRERQPTAVTEAAARMAVTRKEGGSAERAYAPRRDAHPRSRLLRRRAQAPTGWPRWRWTRRTGRPVRHTGQACQRTRRIFGDDDGRGHNEHTISLLLLLLAHKRSSTLRHRKPSKKLFSCCRSCTKDRALSAIDSDDIRNNNNKLAGSVDE